MTDDTLSHERAARVRASFAAQGLMDTLNATLVDLAPGQCRITAPIEDRTGQQHGVAHAGLTFSIGDSAAGYAALTLMADDAEVMTAEMKIHLLAPASGERLVAEGRVIRPGRRLMVAEADVFAEKGGARNLVARLLGTLVPVTVRPR